jgi:hypothetical protein
MLSAASNFHPNCITDREPTIDEPSPMRNDQFDHKNRSTRKNKRKVIKQVYHVKKYGRLNKNLDLILDIEQPNIEESSASIIDQIVPNKSCLARGQITPKWLVLKELV